MKNLVSKSVLVIALFSIIGTGAAIAQSSLDESVKIKDAALKSNIIGETVSGYLEFVQLPTPDQVDISRAVNEINAARKGVFIKAAQNNGTTIEKAGLASAYKQINDAKTNGHYFKDQNGQWCIKSDKALISATADGIVIKCTK